MGLAKPSGIKLFPLQLKLQYTSSNYVRSSSRADSPARYYRKLSENKIRHPSPLTPLGYRTSDLVAAYTVTLASHAKNTRLAYILSKADPSAFNTLAARLGFYAKKPLRRTSARNRVCLNNKPNITKTRGRGPFPLPLARVPYTKSGLYL